MPYHFFRSSSYNTTYYPFASTSVPNDTSFGLLISSDFFVYDRAQGLPLLGDNPAYEKMVGDQVTMAVHEAPVYVPGINKLFVGVLEQGVLDPTTNKTTTLLNNYFGSYFNGLDDLFVDSHGDIWFADPDYAWNGNRTDTTPQLHAQTYRFPSFPPVNSGCLKIHSTAKHTVYKYDIVDADTAPALINKRPFYYSQEWVPDGVNVAANGFVVAGVGVDQDAL
ncbi:hypothetical protein D6D00_08409 [Aureobasidium pullulans]|nr:hypothetical protein D6D00_08409 [Aureobasidium pullulans]